MRMPWNRAPQTAERAERASAVDVSIARTEAHLGARLETIAAEMQRELTEESGWQLLSDLGGDSCDLSNAARAAIAAVHSAVDGRWRDRAGGIAPGERHVRSGDQRTRAADPRVQRIIDRFWDDADNQLALTSIDAMIGINRALMLEGERFLTVHTSAADSLVKLADIPASEITDVITHPQNRRKALVYKRSWRPARYDWGRGTWVTDTQPMVRYYRDLAAPDPRAPRDDDDDEALELLASVPDLDDDTAILHVRVNNIGLRGVPEVYRAYDWARTHAGTVSDMATMTKALSMFAWRKKIRTRSEAAVRSGASQFQSPPPGPGAVHVSNENVELDPVNVGTGATSNQSATGRQTFGHTTIRVRRTLVWRRVDGQPRDCELDGAACGVADPRQADPVRARAPDCHRLRHRAGHRDAGLSADPAVGAAVLRPRLPASAAAHRGDGVHHAARSRKRREHWADRQARGELPGICAAGLRRHRRDHGAAVSAAGAVGGRASGGTRAGGARGAGYGGGEAGRSRARSASWLVRGTVSD